MPPPNAAVACDLAKCAWYLCASCALPLARQSHRRVVPSSEDERIAHGSCGRGNETSVTGPPCPVKSTHAPSVPSPRCQTFMA